MALRTSLLASTLVLVLVLPCMAEYEKEEDYDMDLLLEVMKRTRGKPASASVAPAAQSSFSQTSMSPVQIRGAACELASRAWDLGLIALGVCARAAYIYSYQSHQDHQHIMYIPIYIQKKN